MIIGIDGNEANTQVRVGIGQYAFALLKEFEELGKADIDFRIYLKDQPRDDLPKEREGWKYKVIGPGPLWTRFALPRSLYFDTPRPDVFFSPSHYGPQFAPVPSAISIMDLSYMHFPDLFKRSDLYQLRLWTAMSVRQAKKIFTISTASKNDILSLYHIPEERVVVTYPGIKFKIQNSKFKIAMEDIKKKYGIEGEYVLFVGTLQPRKNIARLIEAFSRIKKNALQFVIVGKKGWLYEEILAAPQKFGVSDTVKFLEFVTDEELTILYRNALFFVLPSLYEGFGLPVLEAMQNGCPVITSNISSLPEAGGDACLYVDPKSVDDITSRMEKLLESETLRKELKEKGYKQVKKFSWEKTARETLDVLVAMK